MCAKPTGFMEYSRRDMPKRPVTERLLDFSEVQMLLGEDALVQQSARCMDCGIPFCHLHGCPLGNLIPDFNDMVYRGHWRKALELLHSTNNFPEITGRVCPAPCEAACTLSINEEPVTIKQIELAIVEHGWEQGWIMAQPASATTGRRVAIVGSGPAGLAAAQQLARKGHEVTVFEKDEAVGGILRYGIPDFKLDKKILDRRLEQLVGEGVSFETGVSVGADISIRYLRRSFDAVLLAGGARVPRDLRIAGRELSGIHFAMDFLVRQNQLNAGENPGVNDLVATGRDVVVIGGGDTGSDCVGTSLRQKARSVLQLEIMPKPPPTRDESTPWPMWPYQLRTSTSQEEGGERRWNILTKAFLGKDGQVTGLRAVEVEWRKDGEGRMTFAEVPETEFEVSADLVLLAMGFTREGNAAVVEGFGLAVGPDGNVSADDSGMSSVPGVFVAGDLAEGASLVVRALVSGRCCAAGIDRFLRCSDG